MRRVLAFLIAAAVVVLALQRESALTRTNTEGAPPVAAPVPSGATQNPSEYVTKGFRDRAHLDDHFAKHGREFPGLSEAQYLAMAQALRDAPAGGEILEIIRESDGVVSRFDRRSGAFLAFDRDGTIRTFFKPNDGEQYFRRQANRPPNP